MMSTSAARPRLPSVVEILARPRPLRDVNAEHAESLTRVERLAIFISDHVGTPTFFFAIVLWTIFWLSWNLLAPHPLQFDRPTAFVLWLFMSNLIQIFLMPLIMVAQNLQDRHTQLRAENDFQVNKHSSEVIDVLLKHIEYQSLQLAAIAEKLGTVVAHDSPPVMEGSPPPPQ